MITRYDFPGHKDGDSTGPESSPTGEWVKFADLEAEGRVQLLQTLAIASLVDKVARLNPDAGEIGAGMLASLVSEARRIQGVQS